METGNHIIAEFRNCNPELLKKVRKVRPIVEKSVSGSGLTKICSKYHQFRPFGVTGFVLLTESHISVHTWPEKCYVAVDIFTCGPREHGERAFEILREHFGPKSVKMKSVKRE